MDKEQERARNRQWMRENQSRIARGVILPTDWCIEMGDRGHGTMLSVFGWEDSARGVCADMDRLAPGFIHVISGQEIRDIRERDGWPDPSFRSG